MPLGVPTTMPKGGGERELIPPDSYPAVCIGVIDLGSHDESYMGGPLKKVRKIRLQFELDHQKADGSNAVFGKTFNYGWYDTSGWKKMLDAWLGTGWTEKYKGQNLGFLLTLPALVQIGSGPSKRDPDRTINWIVSIGPLPRKMVPLEPTKVGILVDLEDKVLPEHLGAWDAEYIRESYEYKAGGFIDKAPRPETPTANGNGSHAAATPPRRNDPSLPPAPSKTGNGGAPFDELADHPAF